MLTDALLSGDTLQRKHNNRGQMAPRDVSWIRLRHLRGTWGLGEEGGVVVAAAAAALLLNA